MKLARTVVLMLAVAAPAFAGDQEANALLRQAYDHWKDPQPAEALRLAEEALAQNPTNQVLRTQIQLFLGSLHQVKTGNLDVALEKYDAVIRSLVGVTDTQLLQLKAEAMVRKGNILYSEKDDPDGALRLYSSAHQAFQQSTTVDTASQLAYRMGRDEKRSKADRDTFMEFALKAAQEAVQIAPRQFTSDATRQANNLAKCKLQLVIVLTALGRADEAASTWASIEQDKLNEASLYQQAMLHAIKGDGDAATDCLTRFLATRPAGDEGAVARNQLRKFIRTEPDFAALRERPDWKTFVEDEPIRNR
jgi:tetratricopeptide (TPR) repeat protein